VLYRGKMLAGPWVPCVFKNKRQFRRYSFNELPLAAACTIKQMKREDRRLVALGYELVHEQWQPSFDMLQTLNDRSGAPSCYDSCGQEPR